MRIFNCYYFLTVILFFGSCDSLETAGVNKNNNIVKLIEAESGKDVSKYKCIFFIPSEGCGSCISGAETFLMYEYSQEDSGSIFFVVTGLTSEKNARIRFGDQILGRTNVYFDYKGKFGSPPFFREFPKVVFLKDGDMQRDVDVNPSNSDDVYKKLKNIEKG